MWLRRCAIVNSKKKGKVGELEFVHKLRDYGFTAQRSVQYCGRNGTADVICDELSNYHFEVKRNETLNIEKALQQAINDSQGNIPIVAHRKNREDWKITMRLEDFINLVKK